jgi:hypothetical protein
MRHPRWLLLPILICALGLAGVSTPPLDAGRLATTPSPRDLIVQTFADLNAHRFHAAWLREAPCGISVSESNGPGAPAGSEGFAGRGKWITPHGASARHPILASARVTAIRRLRVPLLERNHILVFGVSGWFRFDYSAIPWANDTHRSGYHVIKLAVWRCAGRWGVEPSYWESSGGGPLNWT